MPQKQREIAMNLLTSLGGPKWLNDTFLQFSTSKMRTFGNLVNTPETKKSLKMRDLRVVVN